MDNIIRKLDLKPHPEGGYYRETYRSKGEIDKKCLGNEYGNKRNYSTCIYHLITSDSFSSFHRLTQDETWHFYDGSPISFHQITPEGLYSNTIIGRNIAKGEVPQFVIGGGNWFAACVTDQNSYALIGCTVSPGFDFDDFELARRNELINIFPHHKEVIIKYTRE